MIIYVHFVTSLVQCFSDNIYRDPYSSHTHCTRAQVDPFLVSFNYSSTTESVQMEIEIVKIWLLSIYGVRLRRISGSTWLFKQLYSNVVSTLNIE